MCSHVPAWLPHFRIYIVSLPQRIDRTNKNREDAKVRRQKTEQAWKELHDD